MKIKNNLDERQEQVLLKIEHYGCAIAFWGLLIVILVEEFVLNHDFRTIVGEWTVFMVLSVYLYVASMKNGIWDRVLKPNFRTNLILSLIAGLVFGLLVALDVWKRFPDKLIGSIAAGIMSGLFIFIPCIVTLTLSAKRINKKISEQEAEADDQLEDE